MSTANEMSSMGIGDVIETTGLGVFGKMLLLKLRGALGIQSLGLKLRKFM